MTWLAEVVAADPLISGDWLLKVIPVTAAALVLIIGRGYFKQQGRAEVQEGKVTLEGQPVAVKLEEHFVTRREFDRLERMTDRLGRDLNNQYKELSVAAGDREQRITDKLDGIARAIHARIDEMDK